MPRQFIAGFRQPVFFNEAGTERQFVVFSLYINETVPPILQYLRPDADDTDGSWTDQSGGTTLYAAIDETDADDADYIRSVASPSADACKIRLSNPASAPAEPLRVRYRFRKGGDETIDLVVRLYEGAGIIATWTHTDISNSFVTETQTLSGAEFASITDFDDLYIGFEADVP